MVDLVYTHVYVTFISIMAGGGQNYCFAETKISRGKIENIELCGQEKGLLLGLSLLVKYHLI